MTGPNDPTATDQPDPPPPRSARQWFEQLVDADPDQQQAALHQLAAQDPELARRVKALLDADLQENDPTLDDPPPFSPPPKPKTFLQPGDRFENYTILEHLGDGGFGSVYKAEQRHPIRRTVALKLVKPGVDTREVLARFSSERQALARMEHPHIAKVIDAGSTDAGRPYFVMEYVPGKPLTTFADDNKLTLNQRLELFKQVCDAINHAHIKQIIHRDIKSANVLAYRDKGSPDGKPTVKVIDFGVAKALTSDRLTDLTFNTAQGAAIGTYTTMSPEQAAGSPDIDTRTDVYSLGVLLYELLLGVKPFDWRQLAKSADHEVRRIIREVDPPAPSTRLTGLDHAITERLSQARQLRIDELRSQLKRELEWIPLMAMRKEPARRYTSAMQLAEDIENYLEGRALIAGPESQAYQLQKFIRRNTAPLAIAATVLLLLSAGIIGTATQAIRADRQARQALRSANEAQSQTLLAQTEARRASEAERVAIIARQQAEAAQRVAELSLERQRLANIDIHLNNGDFAEARRLLVTPTDPSLDNEWYWRAWAYARASSVIDRIDLRAAFPERRTTLATVNAWGSLGFHHGRLIAHARPVDPISDRSFGLFVDVETQQAISPVTGLAKPSPGRARLNEGRIKATEIHSTTAPVMTVALHVTGSGQVWSTQLPSNDIRCAAYCPINTTAAISSSKSGIHLIQLHLNTRPTPEPRVTLIPPHGDRVIALTFSEDGSQLHGLTDDWHVLTWRLPGQTDLTTSVVHPRKPARRLNYTRDAKRLLVGSYGGGVSVWDTDTRQRLLEIQAHPPHEAYAFGDVVEVPGNNSFVSSTWKDAYIREHNLQDGIPGRIFNNHQHMGRIVFSDNGRYMFASSAQTGANDQLTIRRWDLKQPDIPLISQPVADPAYQETIIYNIELFDQGRTLAVVLRNAQAVSNPEHSSQCVFLDTQTLKPIGSIPTTHQDTLRDLHLSPDGHRLAISSRDGTASVWDWRNRTVLARLEVQPGRAVANVVSSVRFHPSRPVLLTTILNKAVLWDTNAWRPVAELPIANVEIGGLKEAAFHPDGSQLVLAAGNELWWIDLTFHHDTIDRLRAERDPQTQTTHP